MPNAIITVDMGFGDSGKGTAVDYLTKIYEADLNVRYSGGFQAAHNVIQDDGRHHTFSLFGSGTFHGASTYIGPQVIVNFDALSRESAKLNAMVNIRGKLLLDRNCLVSTPYHIMANRIKEMLRGDNKHGSCGSGIGETRKYWLDYGADAITVEDISESWYGHKTPDRLENKLELLRQRLLYQFGQTHNLNSASLGLYDLNPRSVAKNLKEQFHDSIIRHYQNIVDDLPKFNMAIFEAAQGVLIDENFGFNPYTTWSTVTALHAIQMLPKDTPNEILGITRTYMARHGAGPLPSEFHDNSLKELHNQTNRWQGAMRVGWLDIPMLEYAMRCQNIDGWFVTHCDIPVSAVCTGYNNDLLEEMISKNTFPGHHKDIVTSLMRLNESKVKCEPLDPLECLEKLAPVKYISYGPKTSSKERKVAQCVTK